MDVKKGYQQTEVGAIPEDWKIKLLIDCCDYVDYRGKTPHKTSSGTFLITARNVRKGFIDYDVSKEYVPTAEYDFTMSRGKPQLGDVLITTEAPLGNVAQIDREDVALAQRIIKYRPKDLNLSANYLKHYLLSDRFQAILNSRSSGSTATGIKGSVLHQLPVVIPPLAEQQAIAEALSDADALIESLEHLLAKKRQIKQGAMQELLTGRRRLEGFVGEWERNPFGDLATIRKQKIDPGKNDVPLFCVELEHIEQATGRLIGSTETTHTSSIKSVFKEGDVLFGKLRAYLRKYWLADRDGVCTTEIWALIANPLKTTKEYLFQLVQTNGFVETASMAYGTHMPRTDWNVVKNYEFLLPTLPEQTAIANILSDIDAEIAALEAKLVKARQVKQGMMQELLTGRVRLG